MLLVLLHIHFTSSKWQWHNMGNITMQNPTPSPVNADDFLSNHFAGVLSFSTLMDLPSNALNIQLLFPYPQLHLDWSFTKHRRKWGESYKQDLTSGIDWIDSTKLSSNDSQIASFTATERWQSRRLWEVQMLSSNCNFKSADRTCRCLQPLFAGSHSLYYTITVHVPVDRSGLGTDTALHTEPASPWVQLSSPSDQILERFCFSSEIVCPSVLLDVWALWKPHSKEAGDNELCWRQADFMSLHF